MMKFVKGEIDSYIFHMWVLYDQEDNTNIFFGIF